jgi:hypothetical protein
VRVVVQVVVPLVGERNSGGPVRPRAIAESNSSCVSSSESLYS